MCTYSYVYDGEPECPDLPCGKEAVVLSVCHLIHEVLPRQARDNQYDNSTRVHFCTGSLPTTVSRSVKCVKDEEQAGCQAADGGVDGCAAASAALDWECQYVGTSCDAFGAERRRSPGLKYYSPMLIRNLSCCWAFHFKH